MKIRLKPQSKQEYGKKMNIEHVLRCFSFSMLKFKTDSASNCRLIQRLKIVPFHFFFIVSFQF